MSTKTSDMIFFNKEGYPYNLTYDETTNQWSGKIYFDVNSSDTFKTLCLYIFENVEEYTFDELFDLRASQMFNWSGMTFVPYTYTGETITDIQRVNNSENFYSKWIYGDRFDRKFPVGSVVAFYGVTGSTDLSLNNFHGTGITYYNVLGTQKNAFLITTLTNNKNFDFVFSGGTVSSISVIKSPDYADQNLVDINNLNYYKDKKLSVANSSYNDGVYIYDDYNILKTKVYDFLLTPESYVTGAIVTLSFYLMTQRPELYEGNIEIIYDGALDDPTGTTIEFFNYINTNIDFTTTGQTIIFEKTDGTHIDTSDPEFTITGFINREHITTDALDFYVLDGISTIEAVSGITGLTYNDTIELIASPYVTGYTLHDRRQFQVINVEGNKMQVREYIIPETGFTYNVSKVIKNKKIRKLYCTRTGVTEPDTYSGYTICYSTSNLITLTQDILFSGDTTYFYENTISSMRNKYRNLLDRYGLNLYHYHYSGYNYLMFDGLDYNYTPYYSGATATIGDNALTVGNNFTYLTTGSTYQDSDVFYFKTQDNLEKYEKIYHYDSDKLAKKFSTEIYMDLYQDSTSYGFNVNLNYIDYYIQLSGSSSGTTTYTKDTIDNFIYEYSDILDLKGINVSRGYTYSGYTGYTLIFEGQQPNVELYNVEVKVNSYSEYSFISKITNHSIVVSSDELYLVNSDNTFYDYGLSTGMLINISGCTHTINNKQYNIIRVTPNILQLSYQGPFLYEYNSYLKILINSFLRTPRGSYDREVYYKLSWIPIKENDPQVSPDIFFYDYSGSQLESNGNLTYVGPTPLWSSTSTSKVFLNKDPNTNINKVGDPEYQQTIFDYLQYPLEELNSTEYYDYTPVPMEVFIGFNSKNEGVSKNIMKIEKIDDIIFSGTTSSSSNIFIYTGTTSGTSYISYVSSGETFFSFNDLGFETGQHISISFLEDTVTGHTIFGSYGTYEILDVINKRIAVDGELESFDSSASGKTYDYVIKTEPDQIAEIQIFGQTEIEDERLVQHLKLLGADMETEMQPIFKEFDINEIGIDYTILNRKRKELLSIYPEIYNYIGAYKALINAINYFGYNDLELYEYYRNIKKNSPLYGKLQKVLIEDIFINTIPGWDEPEIDHVNYLKTNLFNLTYKITDFDGNYVNMYSLDEVQIKLTKLVKWLRNNIIPLSSNILDITGVASAVNKIYMSHDASNYAKKIVVSQEVPVINFNYIQTLNIDTNYLFTINFYLTSGSTMPDYWTAKIKTFHLNETTRELEPVQYHNLYKKDLLSYSFNVDRNIDPFMYIETQTYNDYGLGYVNSKLFNYDEGRNFILINNNFTGVNYKYLTDNDAFYIITNGRYYIIPY